MTGKQQRHRPHRLVVSNSERGDFNSCRMLHRFRYVDLLRPRAEARVLTWGTVFHAGVETGYLAAAGSMRESWGAVLGGTMFRREAAALATEAAESAAVVAIARGAAEAGEALRGAGLDAVALDERLDDLDKLVATGTWAVCHFLRQTLPLDLEQRVLLAVELSFTAPVLNSVGRASALWYSGKIDAVWFDYATQRVVVDDHKTTDGDATATGIEKRIQLDPQMSGYLYAVRALARQGALVPMWGPAEPVPASAVAGWCRYNLIKRAAPREPSINKDGTVSAAAIETTGAIYEAALLAQEQERGKPRTEKQSELLGRLVAQQDRWCSRQEFARGAEDEAAWLADLRSDAKLMRLVAREPALATRNPGHCTRANSMPCSYRRLCLQDSPEVRAEFRLADEKHEEVNDGRGQEEGRAQAAPVEDVGF